MGRPKPPVLALGELVPDQLADFFALLVERTRGATREGKPYFLCRFRDRKRTVSFMVWSDGKFYEECDKVWIDRRFYKLRATYNEHERYGPQIDLLAIRPATEEDRADGFDPAEFVEHSRFDREQMFQELRALAETNITDEPLRGLVLGLLDRHADALKNRPATIGKFHPFAGGLLEHTLSVTKTCLWLVERYSAHYPDLKPPLNRDLVIASAILHDLGRVLEFNDDVLVPQPTVAGRLFGHLFLARDMIRDAAREQGDVNPELVQILEHIIVTHLSLPEWGSPRLPLVPECLILHHADDLDAKLEMYARCLTRDTASGPFTDRDPILGRTLFKGRTV
jgi:3'-5' exoribonuclease